MKFTILGAGTWGTAVAQVLCDNNNDVMLYHFDQNIVNDINKNHKNSFYFDDLILNENLQATSSLEEAIKFGNNIIFAVPSQNIEELLGNSLQYMEGKYNFINLIKGFVGENNELMISYLRRIIPSEYVNTISSLIGPSHAEEVIFRKVTALCFVNKDINVAEKMQKAFSNEYFRVYAVEDEVGSEFAASYKNAIAIGSGILEGLGFGDNAKAAFITRGLAEMMMAGKAFGGRTKTFLGLTGVGDLLVTCNSRHSRNFMFGYQIGQTKNVDQVIKNYNKTVEGYKTVKSLYEISKRENLSTPIIDALYNVLYKGSSIEYEASFLMNRPLKKEF